VTHYESSLQHDLTRLHTKLAEMGARDEQSLRDGLAALLTNDRQLAYSIILRDTFIDALDREIDRLCLEFIIRQQPVGLHLRFAAAAIKVNLELERVGDYARSIARRVLRLSRLGAPTVPASYKELAESAIPLLGEAIAAFNAQDVEVARRIIGAQAGIEALRSRCDQEIYQARQAEKISLAAFDPLMTISRRFERVADQAKNISQETIYMVTGEYAKHERGAVLRVIFVDIANAGASQMAEAIGQSLGDPRFLFSSAGVSPKSLDQGLVEFLATKDIDLVHAKPRSVTQVPNLDRYQVFIALTPEAGNAFPPEKARTVNLEWTLPDPAAGKRLGAAAAYEETWEYLQGQIRFLVQALLGEQEKSQLSDEARPAPPTPSSPPTTTTNETP
jgi:phosphate transport system protein